MNGKLSDYFSKMKNAHFSNRYCSFPSVLGFEPHGVAMGVSRGVIRQNINPKISNNLSQLFLAIGHVMRDDVCVGRGK